MQWRKSSYSGTGDGNCVEIGWTIDLVAIRDSKNTGGPTLSIPHGAWGTFLAEQR